MKNKMSASMFQKEQVMESIKQSFVKLNPRMMVKNPIMFTPFPGFPHTPFRPVDEGLSLF